MKKRAKLPCVTPSVTDRCFLPDLAGLSYVQLRRTWPCGADRDRTDDLLVANEALSQLSYSPGTIDTRQSTTDKSG